MSDNTEKNIVIEDLCDIYLFKVKDFTTTLLGRYDKNNNCFFVQRGDGTKYEYNEDRIVWKQKLICEHNKPNKEILIVEFLKCFTSNGVIYYLVVNGKSHKLRADNYKKHAIHLLKNRYGFDVKKKNVNFNHITNTIKNPSNFVGIEQNKIEFIEIGGFVGEQYLVKVNKNIHTLQNDVNTFGGYKKQAVQLLYEGYGIEYKIEDVNFITDNSYLK